MWKSTSKKDSMETVTLKMLAVADELKGATKEYVCMLTIAMAT